MSIFRDVVKSENSYTYMLRNLMEHDEDFGKHIFKRFLGDQLASYNETPFRITNQSHLLDLSEQHGRPDIVIEAADSFLVVEAKVTTTCELTPLESPSSYMDRGYISYLQKLEEGGKKTKIVYLLPNYWRHEAELHSAVKFMPPTVLYEIVRWRDIARIAEKSNDSWIKEFGKHLETIGMDFKLNPHETELLNKYCATFPGLVIKMNRLMDHLRQAVPTRLISENHQGFSAEGSDAGGEYGVSFKDGKKYLAWVGIWKEIQCPFVLAIEKKYLYQGTPFALEGLREVTGERGWRSWDLSIFLTGSDPSTEIEDLLTKLLIELSAKHQ